ncbi:MAG: macro domain-containing protein [Actinomycetota bacterium]
MEIKRVRDNIFRLPVEAIVNPANEQLREGGGMCGAIFGKVRRKGGDQAHRQLTDACRRIGHCPTGEAVITPSFGLSIPHIIHAVGPIWTGRKPLPVGARLTESEASHFALLESTYCSILHLCEADGIKSVAIPGISTGIFGFPKELAAAVAVAVCQSHDIDMTVNLVAYDDVSFEYLLAAPSAVAIDWVRSVG